MDMKFHKLNWDRVAPYSCATSIIVTHLCIVNKFLLIILLMAKNSTRDRK